MEPSEKLPWWLRLERDLSAVCDNTRRGIRYNRQRALASGPWTDRRRIRAIYREKDRRNARGGNWVVDHIVPLCSPWVCGLECHWNMQIIAWEANAAKSNSWWPRGPMDVSYLQGDFFTDPLNGQDLLVPVNRLPG